MSDQMYKQVSGMKQVVTQTPTDAALLAAAEVPRTHVLAGTAIKTIVNVGEVMDEDTVLAEESVVRLSKNMKLAMAHKGFTEVEATWKTAPSYEEVADGSTTVYRYVAPGDVGVDNGSDVTSGQQRPTIVVADTDDGIIITDNGTFTKTTITPPVGDGVPAGVDSSYISYDTIAYDGNASSSSANDGLTGARSTAMASDLSQELIVDAPGTTGGESMDGENYLQVPGRAIRTSFTHTALIAFIGQIADGIVVKTELAISDLQNAGIPTTMLVSANLTDYQDAIAATGDATSVNTVSEIAQIIVDANAAA